MLKVKKITPLYTTVVTTMDKYTENQYLAGSSVIDTSKTKSSLKEYQTVITVGSAVRIIKPGDLVCINPSRYKVVKQVAKNVSQEIEGYSPTVVGYNFNIVKLNDIEYLMLQENDIEFIVDEYEEVNDTPQISIVPSNIIL